MIKKLQLLLLSSDVDVRITAGEAIALILEFAYDYDEVLHCPAYLCSTLFVAYFRSLSQRTSAS